MSMFTPKVDSFRIPHEFCPAKAYADQSGAVRLGFNVIDHTYIVGMVAKEIVKIFPQQLVDAFFPNGIDLNNKNDCIFGQCFV